MHGFFPIKSGKNFCRALEWILSLDKIHVTKKNIIQGWAKI